MGVLLPWVWEWEPSWPLEVVKAWVLVDVGGGWLQYVVLVAVARREDSTGLVVLIGRDEVEP